MKRRFRKKYRVDTWRAPWWDYRDPGLYFITICTRKRYPFFGEISNARMHLSPVGQILDDEWNRTAFVRPNVRLDEAVIMPNHFHGLLEILYPWPAYDPPEIAEPHRRVRLTPGSLGAIVGQIKSQTTKRAWAAGFSGFGWQERYHDRIVRATEIDRIRRYIRNNPARWEHDRFFAAHAATGPRPETP